MQAYDDFTNGRLPDFEFNPADEDAALAELPEVSIPGLISRTPSPWTPA